MGQVKSHLSGYFGKDSGKSCTNNGDLIQNKKYTKNVNSSKEKSENDSLYFPFGILATPRNPLKRTRQISPISLPQSISDIFSPAKKPKIQDDYLDFPFLENKDTIDYFRKSKIMVILRGLPGSGKSTIAKHIERKHISCRICSADNFFMKDGEYVYDRSLIKEAHAQCQENAIKAVEEQISVVVIDNTNLKLWEMNFYLNLAKKFHYVPLIIESKTPWRTDISQLVSKTLHDIDENIIELKKNDSDELLPIYYGWFLNEKDSHLFIEEGKMWIEAMSKIPEFLNDMQRRTKVKSFEGLLEYYKFAQDGILHCTSNFIGKYLSEENKEYIEKCQSVIGKSFNIEVIGFVLTPRTLGVRVKLTKEQLAFWGKDDGEDVPQEFFEDDFSLDCDIVNGNIDVPVSNNSGIGSVYDDSYKVLKVKRSSDNDGIVDSSETNANTRSENYRNF
ncbi:2',3'-cyclic-nucleotide 3'-phosphodiesterase [Armadillidium vulgare]|nr:2',3'-cyclic-nucleotide 3'-phosphodiesterase [Armadillidium vulgare]